MDPQSSVQNPSGEQVSMETRAGVTLRGVLYGAEPTLCAVLVCPPHPVFGEAMDPSPVSSLCRTLAQAGALALSMDYRGVGRSMVPGDHGRTAHRDVLAWLVWLRRRTSLLPHVVGCSFGAAMALDSYRQVASVCCVGLPTVYPAHEASPGEVLEESRKSGLKLLFLSAEQDQVSDAAWLRRMFGGELSSVETLPGRGHGVEGAAQRRLAEAVKSFLGLPRPTGRFREWINGRLEDQRAAAARVPDEPLSGHWPTHFAVQHDVLLFNGDNLTLWFIDREGAVYSLDLDALNRRLEREKGEYARDALRRASRFQPELCELLSRDRGAW